ncbi:MAG: hypothetical protein ACLSAH_10225 [Bilophila wadsworthia]
MDAFEMGGFHARYVRGEVVAQRVEKEIHRLAEAHIAVFLVDVGEGGVDVRKVADGLAVQVAQAVRAVQFGISGSGERAWMPERICGPCSASSSASPCRISSITEGSTDGSSEKASSASERAA